MAIKSGTYQELLVLKNDINKQVKASPAFKAFNEHKIKEFFQRNDLLLQLIEKKLKGMEQKYIVHDEENKPIVLSGDGIYVKYQFKDEASEKSFLEEYAEFMGKQIKMHC